MKITAIRTWFEEIPLSRPFKISFKTFTHSENFFVEIKTDKGITGYGGAAPEEYVTGESLDSCKEALTHANLQWLIGKDVRELQGLLYQLNIRLAKNPAAQAGLDIALHDIFSQFVGLPLCDVLGRVHTSLPTSMTLGIMTTQEAAERTQEYLGRGFKVLKVKLGTTVEEDVERLTKIRELAGKNIMIYADPNQAYSSEDVIRFVKISEKLNIEFLEQPMKAKDITGMKALPDSIKDKVAADECLLDEFDALPLLTPPRAAGIFNIKLMKCGGIYPARRIAALAEMAGIKLMWGCMSESVVSIAGALHIALATPNTKYLDLDSSFDLAYDLFDGGIVLKDGYLSTTNAPGLGITVNEKSAAMKA